MRNVCVPTQSLLIHWVIFPLIILHIIVIDTHSSVPIVCLGLSFLVSGEYVKIWMMFGRHMRTVHYLEVTSNTQSSLSRYKWIRGKQWVGASSSSLIGHLSVHTHTFGLIKIVIELEAFVRLPSHPQTLSQSLCNFHSIVAAARNSAICINLSLLAVNSRASRIGCTMNWCTSIQFPYTIIAQNVISKLKTREEGHKWEYGSCERVCVCVREFRALYSNFVQQRYRNIVQYKENINANIMAFVRARWNKLFIISADMCLCLRSDRFQCIEFCFPSIRWLCWSKIEQNTLPDTFVGSNAAT